VLRIFAAPLLGALGRLAMEGGRGPAARALPLMLDVCAVLQPVVRRRCRHRRQSAC
jgi:hypothetical protein